MPGGAPVGNNNAVKNRPITDALRRALLQGDGKRLRKLVDALLDKACEGDVPAAKEVNERIEGKVPQAITGADGAPLTVQIVRLGDAK